MFRERASEAHVSWRSTHVANQYSRGVRKKFPTSCRAGTGGRGILTKLEALCCELFAMSMRYLQRGGDVVKHCTRNMWDPSLRRPSPEPVCSCCPKSDVWSSS